MKEKMRVGILFGGQSAEHEVSLQSARSIIQNIDQSKYEPVPIGIDKEGNWSFLSIPEFLCLFEKNSFPTLEEEGAPSKGSFFFPSMLKEELDIVFPVLHGPNGEDGTVQGLIKLANLPCVGPDVLSSAVCMDKEIMKRLLIEAGIPTPRFWCLHDDDIVDQDAIAEAFEFPLFVKPANMGSSVGISKVHGKDELLGAIEEAFQFDRRVLIEEFISGKEIECSVLGNLNPIASLPGEIIPKHEFYSYEAKYLDESGAYFELPAKLNPSVVKEIQDMAILSFKSLKCEGMARVDFFLREDGTLFVNELNTIPGFTTISLYPKLWELSGIPYPKLVDQLIELAIESFKRKKLSTSNLLALNI